MKCENCNQNIRLNFCGDMTTLFVYDEGNVLPYKILKHTTPTDSFDEEILYSCVCTKSVVLVVRSDRHYIDEAIIPLQWHNKKRFSWEDEGNAYSSCVHKIYKYRLI